MNKAIFIVLALVFLFAVISLSTFLGSSSGPTTTFKIKPNENTVLFAVTPWGDPVKIKESYKPLIKYLSEKSGKKFQYLGMEDYEIAVDNVIEGNVDISVLVPVSYIKARERDPSLQYIATALMGPRHGAYGTYKGVLITLKNKYRGMTLEDFLKNPKKYTIGYVSKSSASGWAYPAAMMKKRGIDPINAFKETIFLQNHPAVFEELISGKIDIGASWDGSLNDSIQKYGDIFNVIYTSNGIPNDVWVASKNVDPLFVKKLRDILMEINNSEELKDKLLSDAHDKGWMMVENSYYDGLREVMSYVSDYK